MLVDGEDGGVFSSRQSRPGLGKAESLGDVDESAGRHASSGRAWTVGQSAAVAAGSTKATLLRLRCAAEVVRDSCRDELTYRVFNRHRAQSAFEQAAIDPALRHGVANEP